MDRYAHGERVLHGDSRSNADAPLHGVDSSDEPATPLDLQLQSNTLFPNSINKIAVSVSGTEARFEIDSWDWGIGVAEDLGQSKQLFIWGQGARSVGRSTMVGVLTGGFEQTDYSGYPPVEVKCESFQLEAVRR